MSEGKKFTFYFSFVAAACFLLPSAGMALDYPPSDVEICSCTAINAIYYNASGSSSCKILKNIEPLIDVYKNRTKQFCVVTTKECDDGRFYWNGIEYYHGRFASKENCDNGAAVFKYHLEPGEATQAENGSSAEFVFLDAQNRRTSSNISVIRIIGPPTPPTDIMVDVSRQRANISWTRAPSLIKAECYVVTIKCGGTFVVQNVTVYTNSYELNYHPSLRKQCIVSVYAVNPAGSSAVKNITIKIAKDPEYESADSGVKITNGNAIFYFNITVNKDFPFSHPQNCTICAGDGRCVTSDCNEITELRLPLHKRLIVTIVVCTLINCTNLSRPISTYHVQKADVTCDTNGMCSLVCNFAEGHQIKGCVFVFTDRMTNKELPPVFVDNAKNVSYTLKPGAYNVTVYDWKGNDRWKDLGPAVTQQITVEKNTIENDTGTTIGLSIGIPAAVVLIVGILLIVFISWYYKKRGRYQISHGTANRDTENPPNNGSFELDIMEGTTGTTDNSDKKSEATIVTDEAEQRTTITDFNEEKKDPKSSTPPLTSTPPPSVPEPTVEEGMTDTSVYESDKPLLSTRDPQPKRQKESGDNKLLAEMIYPESKISRFTNTSQLETGKSIKTGDPTVTDEGKDKSAAYVYGKHVKDKGNEIEFSLATSSEAQLGDVNSQLQVVPGATTSLPQAC